MKNVTISMDEATLGTVRVRAATAGQSVSRWIGEQLTRLVTQEKSQEDVEAAIRAIDEFLAEPGWPISEGDRAFDRAALYDDDERFRRFDDPHLSQGSSRPGQAAEVRGMAEGVDPSWPADDKPSSSE
jgi:plasmid stability protein